MTFFNQPADHGYHVVNMSGRTRLDVGLQDAEFCRIIIHRGNEFGGEVADCDASLVRTIDDLVVDIGDIAHIGDIEAGSAQPAVDHIEHHHHARMAQMTIIVDGHAAYIHTDLAGHNRNEYLLFTSEGVVDFEHFARCLWQPVTR